jgi:hypothetical protein
MTVEGDVSHNGRPHAKMLCPPAPCDDQSPKVMVSMPTDPTPPSSALCIHAPTVSLAAVEKFGGVRRKRGRFFFWFLANVSETAVRKGRRFTMKASRP